MERRERKEGMGERKHGQKRSVEALTEEGKEEEEATQTVLREDRK